MNRTEDEAPLTNSSSHRGFRFGQKALFVVVTLLCVWLGYESARGYRAARMVARHRRVLDTVLANIASPPEHTFYMSPVGSVDDLMRQINWRGDNSERVLATQWGNTASITTQHLFLDVKELINSTKHSDIRLGEISQLVCRHYTDSLDVDGPDDGSMESQPTKGRSTATWTSPGNELVVNVDVEVVEDAADIRIQFIDSQQLRVW
jgi:hypothetical protein